MESVSREVYHEQTFEMTTKLSFEEEWLVTVRMEVDLPQYGGQEGLCVIMFCTHHTDAWQYHHIFC